MAKTRGPHTAYKAIGAHQMAPGMLQRFADLAREGKADEVVGGDAPGTSKHFIFRKKVRDGGFIAGSTKEICILSIDPPIGHLLA